MSYFATALKLILEERQLTQRAFAELAGIDSGLFSRYLGGGPRPSREMIEKISRALPAPRHRAQLVVGHLRDETPPSGADLVRIINLITEPYSLIEESDAENPRLPKKLRDDFRFLMRYAQNHPEVGDWVRATVDVLDSR